MTTGMETEQDFCELCGDSHETQACPIEFCPMNLEPVDDCGCDFCYEPFQAEYATEKELYYFISEIYSRRVA